MSKYKLVEFQIDPEIEKTKKRLKREYKNLRYAANMDDL